MNYFTSINLLLLLFTVVINLSLSIFVLIKNRWSEINRTFSYLLFCIAGWALSFFLLEQARTPEWILFWRRMTPVGSSLAAGYFLCFCLILPEGRKTPLFTRGLIILPGFFFAIISIFSSLMIKSISISYNNNIIVGEPVFGPVYKVYAFYLFIYFAFSLLYLYSKYLNQKGAEKLRLLYVLVGMGIAVFSGLFFSLVMPLLGISGVFTIGPPFTLIMVAFVSYAILKHKLLNIDDFLYKSIIMFSIAIAIVGTIACLMYGFLHFLFSYYVILGNLILGLLFIANNRKNEINLSFAFMALGIAFWNIGVFFGRNIQDPNIATMFGRFAFISATIIPGALFYFSAVFPRKLFYFSTFRKLLVFIPCVIFIILIIFGFVLKEILVLDAGYYSVYGPAYPLFFWYVLILIVSSAINFIKSYNASSGLNRLQMKYLFLGILLTTIVALISNLAFPMIGIFSFTMIGPNAGIIVVAFTAYAIFRHRLMSMEVIIQRSTIYTIATVLIMAFYAFAVILSEIFLRNVIGYSSLLITAAAALLIAVLYQPLIRTLQSFTDKIFFRSRYDYQKTLRQISQQVASVIQLEELTMLLVSSFIDTMKVSEISFLLQDKDKEHFRSISVSLPRYKKIEIDVASPVVAWLQAYKDILVRYEIEDKISCQEAMGREGQERKKSLEEVREEMDRLGISVWIPIVSKGEIIGIIALGDKLSGDIFSAEDIGLLSTLSNQAAVALENARLYDEVVNMKDYSEEILQSMVSGVLTTDFKGRIVTLNQMAEKICGRKFEEVVGKSCSDIWGKRGSITQVIENSLKDRTYINYESGIASPERGLVPVSFSTTLLRDHSGRKIGVLLTIQDLTEVKELEGKVRQADKLGALATMAAGMAHEIKNPLSSMKVLSQLMPLKYDDSEFRKKLQEILPREINRIDRIVESLLGFARASALQFEKSDINALLVETVKYFSDKAKEADVEITTQFAELPEIEVDKGQISQVFSNLILNAIQAMPGGGKIAVITAPGKKTEGILQDINIIISDTGYGINEEMQKKLFDPFFTTKHGGTGLGLTISHSIIDGHKGSIDVESKVGKGTSFTITLPVNQGSV